MAVRSQMDILTTKESGQWMETLEEIGVFDFYHLPSYHKLAETRGEGQAVMPVYRQGNHLIAFPMLLREIDLPYVPKGLKDATSVYGYAGPVSSSPIIREDVQRGFILSLGDFYKSKSVVSAFCRLHPLIDQSALLWGLGESIEAGATTCMDLNVPSDVLVSNYRKSHRYEIQRLRNMGFTCEDSGTSCLADFVRIYQQTMHELEADEHYLFNDFYFNYLMEDMSDVMHLFICRDSAEIACAAMFAVCNGVIQYHLAGTSTQYRRLAPMKLMIDAVREWGSGIGAHTFHLGGGVGGKRDSLFQFKIGFGGQEHTFSVWRYIADLDLYHELCSQAIQGSDIVPDDDFFPLYRHPSFQRGAAVRKCMQ